MGLSKLAIIWFVLTAFVVSIDFTYVLLRPAVPGQPHPLSNNPIFAQWDYYSTFDKRYAPNDDAFVVVQSLLNVVEVSLQLIAVGLHFTSRASNSAARLGLVVSVMTLYKTVMYGMMEHFEGGKYTSHNSQQDLLLMVVIPSSFWILVPGFIAFQCYQKLAAKQTPVTKKLK